MSNYLPKEEEPETPPDTCPYIDFIQQILDEIKSENESHFTELRINLINDTLEYIRNSNDSLRKCGKYWKRQYIYKGKRKSS